MEYNNSILPNSPYNDPTQAIIHSWQQSGWGTWMFNISQFTNTTFMFDKGGYQEARGGTYGQEFYVENVFEELDYPMEWFWNESQKSLYYYNNESDISPADETFERTDLKILFSFVGNMSVPVTNISIQGFTIRDTAITYMDAHGVPSGGDWSLQRQGAIYMSGVENIVISNNIFTRLDGIGISVNRYARNVSINSNEFVWNGESSITLWGDTEGIEFGSDEVTEMGYDGTNGNQPRYINVESNYVHELGIWEKQSSFYFQAKSCLNYVSKNIFFNGPRAGINLNDGFGGRSTFENNLIFNTCRESTDHGPINSWDRQVYVTSVRNGSPSATKAMDEIRYNFLIGNANAYTTVDNDDGSSYFLTHHNFLVYAHTGMKNDFDGYSNYHYFNIYAYVTQGFNLNGGKVGQPECCPDLITNNTFILAYHDPPQKNYGIWGCNDDPPMTMPILGDNIIMTQTGNQSIIGLCNLNEQTFQNTYLTDYGTYITIWNDSYVLNKAYHLLFN